jgi:hypothetical protein
MTHGRPPFYSFQVLHVKNFRNKPHALMGINGIVYPPVDGDSGALLSPVLEGIKAEIGYFCSFRMFVQSEDTAFILGSFAGVK